MQLKGGVIIIGSLLWQDDLNINKNDKVRYNWRNTSLNLGKKILARLPIRYGRHSNGNIYTMVFSTNCEKTKRLGTGYIVPFKRNPIEHLDVLIGEARMMAKAEGMKCKFVGGTNPIWASMGILINKKKVDQKIYEQILSRWAKEFKTDGGGKDSSEYRVRKEKLSISKKGELQIQWPNSVDKGEESRIEEIDFLIAASTKPKYQQQGNTRYPSSNEIATSVRNDLNRRYFMNNFQHRITTFQDNSVINLL
jgi:hypothetical protein